MSRAVVVGAGGGIGGAMVDRLAMDGRFDQVHALSRSPPARRWLRVRPGRIDVCDPVSVMAAAEANKEPIDLLVVATGMSHDLYSGPERSLEDLNGERLRHSFAVNAIGPALVIKHFAPMLPRNGRSVIVCLSARAGSISDNHMGGFYGYRASKAALNQIVRTASIEIARTRPQAVCVALHPGNVDSATGRFLDDELPPGGEATTAAAAERLLAVAEGLSASQSGRCFDWNGVEVPP